MRNAIYRALQALVLLAVAASFAQAGDHQFTYFKKKAAGGTCSTVADNQSSTDGYVNVAGSADTQWFATSFTTASGAPGVYTVCGLGLFLSKQGSPTMDLTVYVYTDNGANSPGTVTSTCETKNASTVVPTTQPASEETKFVSCSNFTTSSSTRYFIVLGSSATNGIAYIRWDRVAAAFGNYTRKDTDGVDPFALDDNSRRLKFNVYK